jgi:Zn-dependent M32 family carboxypeptidase
MMRVAVCSDRPSRLFPQLRARADDTAILPSLVHGEFASYRASVRLRVHQRASLLPFADLVMEATGAALSADSLKRHLAGRYVGD